MNVYIPPSVFGTITVDSITINDSTNTNTYYGYQAGISTTTGEYNSCFGYQAGANITDGIENVALGYQALYSNNSGDSNLAIGRRAMYTNAGGTANVAFGRNALYYNVSGNNNTAVGYNSLNGATGSSNTAIGRNSGNSIGNASNNTFVGYDAGNHASQLATASNSMALGNGTYTTASNQVVVGNDSITDTQLKGVVTINDHIRSSTSIYRTYYHLSSGSFNPGASGATRVNPDANTSGGWQLNAVGEVLYMDVDVHSDWDGASDLTVEIYFEKNTAGGVASDTVDLKLVAYYKTSGDSVTKSQTVEVATTVDDDAQYTMYKAEFTIDYDAVSNVVEAGDVITLALNLETDTSECDDIIINHGSFYYRTTHVGVEDGDI